MAQGPRHLHSLHRHRNLWGREIPDEQDVVALATIDVGRAAEDGKDYVYSTWDDNKLRTYLEQQGVPKIKIERKREELLAMVGGAYAKVTNPTWEAWSTPYIVSSPQPLICSLIDIPVGGTYSTNGSSPTISSIRLCTGTQRTRIQNGAVLLQHQRFRLEHLGRQRLEAWLVQRCIVKSDAQIKQDKLVKLVKCVCFYMVMPTIILIYPPSHKETTTPTHTTSGPTARCAHGSSRMGICAQMHRWGETNWSSSTSTR